MGIQAKYVLRNGYTTMVLDVFPDTKYDQIESILNRKLDARSGHLWVDNPGNYWEFKHLLGGNWCQLKVFTAY